MVAVTVFWAEMRGDGGEVVTGRVWKFEEAVFTHDDIFSSCLFPPTLLVPSKNQICCRTICFAISLGINFFKSGGSVDDACAISIRMEFSDQLQEI